MKMIILLGKTYSGKKSIQQELSNLGIPKILEYTTRPPAREEEQGEPYQFISEREFYNLHQRGYFAVSGSEKAHGGQVWHHGVAARDMIPRSVLAGHPMLVPGLRKWHVAKPVVFYIDTDEPVIYERLRNRLGSIDEAQRRIVGERETLFPLEQFIDYRIRNDGLVEMEDLAREIKDLHEYHLYI